MTPNGICGKFPFRTVSDVRDRRGQRRRGVPAATITFGWVENNDELVLIWRRRGSGGSPKWATGFGRHPATSIFSHSPLRALVRGPAASGRPRLLRGASHLTRAITRNGFFSAITSDGTARDLRCVPVDMGTSQHRMARHDQSRVACVGWRLCVKPTAISPRHPIRAARLGSWLN